MFKTGKETADEYPESSIELSPPEDGVILFDDSMQISEELAELLRKLKQSTWFCNAAEA